MLAIYNERFNSYVARSYAGMTIAAPGLVERLRAFARTRPRRSPGSSSAATLRSGTRSVRGRPPRWSSAGWSMRRLGIIRRPAYVVPNHMLEQFARDFLRLYPAAEVLTVPKDEITPASATCSPPGPQPRLGRGDHHALELHALGLSAGGRGATCSRRRWRAAGPSWPSSPVPRRAARTLTKRLEKAIARYEAKARGTAGADREPPGRPRLPLRSVRDRLPLRRRGARVQERRAALDGAQPPRRARSATAPSAPIDLDTQAALHRAAATPSAR